jgi:hypothetical protein
MVIYLLDAESDRTALAFTGIAILVLLAGLGITLWRRWRGARPMFMGMLTRWMVARGDTSSLFGPYIVRVHQNEIVERGPKSEHRFAISAIQKLVIDAEHVYAYVSPVQAIVIPSRAFGHSLEQKAFVASIEQRTGCPVVHG